MRPRVPLVLPSAGYTHMLSHLALYVSAEDQLGPQGLFVRYALYSLSCSSCYILEINCYTVKIVTNTFMVMKCVHSITVVQEKTTKIP